MREARFGNGAKLVRVVGVEVGEEGGEDGCKGHADANAEEGETGDAGTPVAGTVDDEGIGGEVEVENAVDKGHV